MRMEEHFVAERVYPESEMVSITADSDKHRYTYADAIYGPTNQMWFFPHCFILLPYIPSIPSYSIAVGSLTHF